MKNSPVALTFDAEIKRMAVEKGLETGKVIEILSEKAGIVERHIYHYREGKTDIPAMLIPVFCREFGSNALAMSIVALCKTDEFEDADLFDLGRFASGTVRNCLRYGDEFLETFDDGVIDGFEIAKLSRSSAKIIRDAHRLLEIAQRHYDNRQQKYAA
ncbi:MAG TPA: hypothetical protein PKY59_07600 [Pyrinomonadaceae bacterium]|nr:hypothetical protein [Pyrinomonadaceae bacterium]